jgi:galactose-1-phosphate uridylyltransferase
MKKHQNQTSPALDPITKMAVELAGALAERSRMNKELLIALANAVGTNEKNQHQFRTAVLVMLARIETMLTEVQSCQLVQYWPLGHVSDEQRAENLREVEERVARTSGELGLKMVRHVYGESQDSGARSGRMASCSDWEI